MTAAMLITEPRRPRPRRAKLPLWARAAATVSSPKNPASGGAPASDSMASPPATSPPRGEDVRVRRETGGDGDGRGRELARGGGGGDRRESDHEPRAKRRRAQAGGQTRHVEWSEAGADRKTGREQKHRQR